MKQAIGLIILLLSAPVWASTQLIVRAGDKSASVLMLALTANPDATAFYTSLRMAPTDQGGKESKQSGFIDNEGVRSVEATCAFSKISGATGSCVLKLNAARGMSIRQGFVQYRLEGPEAVRLAELFHPAEGEVFRSTDNHLVMSFVRASPSFEITYR